PAGISLFSRCAPTSFRDLLTACFRWFLSCILELHFALEGRIIVGLHEVGACIFGPLLSFSCFLCFCRLETGFGRLGPPPSSLFEPAIFRQGWDRPLLPAFSAVDCGAFQSPQGIRCLHRLFRWSCLRLPKSRSW